MPEWHIRNIIGIVVTLFALFHCYVVTGHYLLCYFNHGFSFSSIGNTNIALEHKQFTLVLIMTMNHLSQLVD